MFYLTGKRLMLTTKDILITTSTSPANQRNTPFLTEKKWVYKIPDILIITSINPENIMFLVQRNMLMSMIPVIPTIAFTTLKNMCCRMENQSVLMTPNILTTPFITQKNMFSQTAKKSMKMIPNILFNIFICPRSICYLLGKKSALTIVDTLDTAYIVHLMIKLQKTFVLMILNIPVITSVTRRHTSCLMVKK